jgi:hydroxymethylglutaryl-CoA reductase (NADPH)
MTGMRPLWRELAENARPMLDRWAGPELGAVHNRLVNTIDEWWPAAMSQPRTLIHNDFNPRNILLRRVDGALRLCAFDWELATVGAPQRDIAEFLCFALDPERAEGDVASWVERSRLLFEQASSLRLDPQSWTAGFRAATGEVLIDRVAMYAMLHRIRPQAFLPRVARTWLAIHRRAGSTV